MPIVARNGFALSPQPTTEVTADGGSPTESVGHGLASAPPAASTPGTTATGTAAGGGAKSSFFPSLPKELADTGLNEIQVEDLIFKLLLAKGMLTGREVAHALCLHFPLVERTLQDLKQRVLVGHRSTAGIGDFMYQLTEQGQEKALMAREISAYVGPAPVLFEQYVQSMAKQSIRREQPGVDQLRSAFKDLVLDEAMFNVLGPAVNSARGLFLYGEPGNGKTSIAERITHCYQQSLYIPKNILVDGQILKLYDPQTHVTVDDASNHPGMPGFDPRWIRIKRPVVMVGGELTLDALEITYNELLKVCEAPLQMKANGGVFLIDDFGRQRVNHVDLLNRWIVPLEKRVDFLVLPTGKKIEVPFDQLIIFSTNINPSDLVDEAFLRRIPYKVHVKSPSESEFRSLFAFMSQKYGVPYDEEMVSYLIDKHYNGKRPFRACQARDILEQIVNACNYRKAMPQLTPQLLDGACLNYFAAMGT
jgi:predicted ATPase with chaperone activity